MKIQAQDSGVVNEVIFEGDVKGEGMCIMLSEENPTVALSWQIVVFVKLAQGWWLLGFFNTNTAAVDGAAARVVGFASCPGARGWKVTASLISAVPPTNTRFDAELFIQAGLCCGGGSPYGVFIPPPPGTGGVPTKPVGV